MTSQNGLALLLLLQLTKKAAALLLAILTLGAVIGAIIAVAAWTLWLLGVR